MRVFIFEHICGGGMAGVELTSRLVWEGGAMLKAVVEDFVALGAEVVTPLDERVPLTLAGARVTPVKPGTDFTPLFDRLAGDADAALLIAPEFDNLLHRWSTRVAALGVRLLGCSPEAIALAGDKYALSQHLIARGVPTPPTALGLSPPPASWPVMVKPRHGAGCERTYPCRGPVDIDRLPAHDDWIVQPLVPGMAASAAFIVGGGAVRPLRAGEQFVIGRQQLFYHGGRMPLPAELEARALALGERAVRTVPGLHGYVGVDLILGDADAGDQVIELNPRLTVAYVGLRKLCRSNLAAALLDPATPLEWRGRRLSYDASGQVGWETQA